MQFTALKRWLPFILFTVLILTFSGYFLLSSKTSNYKPTTNNPAIIYFEACSHCHGKDGRSENLLYPDLIGERLTRDEVQKIIVQGEWLMPAFKHLKGDTLKNLVNYVVQKKFKSD